MKKISLLLGITFLSTLFILMNKDQVSSLDKTLKSSQNHTLQVYSEVFKNASEEEINAAFQGFPDDQVIIAADTKGGFITNLDNSLNNYTWIVDESGAEIQAWFSDNQYSATIGEVKEYINSVQ